MKHRKALAIVFVIDNSLPFSIAVPRLAPVRIVYLAKAMILVIDPRKPAEIAMKDHRRAGDIEKKDSEPIDLSIFSRTINIPFILLGSKPDFVRFDQVSAISSPS